MSGLWGFMVGGDLVGSLIGGKLQVLSVLGEGAVGLVYLAEHAVLERLFAVKVIKPNLQGDRVAVERFRREARAAARLEHPNIVSISDFGTLDDGRFYFVMEYVPGRGLDMEIHQTAMVVVKACRILAPIARALDYAHEQGVVHRDLKPENIILVEDDRKHVTPKILDFGLAKFLRDRISPITFKGQVFGTPEYMAPEQVAGEEVDHRVDIYALGAVTHELLTGKTPFQGGFVEQLTAHRRHPPPRPSDSLPGSDLPQALDDLVVRCLAKDPNDRYQRASDVADLFENVLSDMTEETTDQIVLNGQDEGADRSDQAVHELCRRKWSEEQDGLRPLYGFVADLRDQGYGEMGLTQLVTEMVLIEEDLFSRRAMDCALLRHRRWTENLARERVAMIRRAAADLRVERVRVSAQKMEHDEALSGLARTEDVLDRLDVAMATVERDRDREFEQIEKRLAEQRAAMEPLQLALARKVQALVAGLMSIRAEAAASGLDWSIVERAQSLFDRS